MGRSSEGVGWCRQARGKGEGFGGPIVKGAAWGSDHRIGQLDNKEGVISSEMRENIWYRLLYVVVGAMWQGVDPSSRRQKKAEYAQATF